MSLLKRVGQFVALNRYKHSTLGAILLLTALFSFLLPTLGAEAATASCRGDPVVKFTNGLQMALSVALDNDGSQVSQVVYTLHAPTGLSVQQVQYTGGVLQHKESFIFYSDETTLRFDAYTVVNANINTNVQVQAQLTGNVHYTDANGHAQNLPVNQTATSAGINGQQIYTSMSW
jgi:hypothetical protein